MQAVVRASATESQSAAAALLRFEDEPMTHYLVYWKPSTVVDDEPWPRIMHSASDQYHRLSIGDVLWVVTSEEPDDLVLIGRQRVDRIVGQEEAERITATPNLWKSEYHAICDEPQVKAYLNLSRWAPQLSFDGVVRQLPEGFTGQHLHYATPRRKINSVT